MVIRHDQGIIALMVGFCIRDGRMWIDPPSIGTDHPVVHFRHRIDSLNGA
jgi:hypothetical protein